jgi:3-hydroxyisobutyrate dehydrogenase-like beta-hydroxyacid dehydrogenase
MTTLGFVGLGHMGGNMAVRLLGAGYAVYGEKRQRGEVRELEREGLVVLFARAALRPSRCPRRWLRRR